ncbi:MAG TPA: HD domain-containing protein, partial [Nitrospiria bacterium]|nr:HD domain-containing protein [Nitrospiria bacterium]
MLKEKEIIDRVISYNPNADTSMISRAYGVCLKSHAGQLRESGEPYAVHPMEVALILTQLKLDVPSIVAGLLHDIVEDTQYSMDQLTEEFGEDIAQLVDGVTKISKIQFKNYEEKQAENFRKMIISMAEDIRVVLIKLADRLHNMRTLQYLPEHKQMRIAQETLEIYAPLANRLGIGWIKSELEDLCLRYLKPEAYFSLSKKVSKKREERQKYLERVIEAT